MLIQVESSFATVELTGRREPPGVLLKKDAWPIPGVKAESRDSPLVLSTPFPLLFEEEEYQLLAQSRIPGEEISVGHRDERTLKALRAVPHSEPSTVMGAIRFRQSVGLSAFSFCVGGRVVRLTVEVFPAKLDYLADHEAMVSDVQALDRSLPLRYFDETYRKMSIDRGASGGALEWLSILRSQVDDLGRSLRYANRHPLIAMETDIQPERPHRVRAVTSQVRRAVVRGQGSGPREVSLPGIPARRHLSIEVTRDTFDSFEHRWLRGRIASVKNALTRLIQLLRAAEEQRRARYRRDSSSALEQRSSTDLTISEIEQIHSEVAAMEGLSIIQNASRGRVPSNVSSLRLLRTPGYSEAYRVLMALQLGLAHVDGGVDVSIDRLGSLYEAWCFVEILRQVESLTGASLVSGLDGFVSHDAIGARLVKGKGAEAVFMLPDGRRLTVRYNRSYHGLTGTQIPDIELAFSKVGWPDLVVLFDAKYRLNVTAEHIDFYGMPAPPQDAIGALHRYRDAIVVDGGHAEPFFVRPVVKGAALFPLSSSESEEFEKSKLALALEKYGIGAIPLLPGNSAHVYKWLDSILRLSHTELARGGPPAPGAGGTFADAFRDSPSSSG